jgi:thermostable 8-oxoguanine DNA glycosylase
MIDPEKIVRYDYTDAELEELLIFCVCVAGKTAKTIAPRVDKLCHEQYDMNDEGDLVQLHLSPFEWLRSFNVTMMDINVLEERVKALGIGCYSQKAETISEILRSGLDLRTCSVSDLETIKGIGPKTSRFFIMSSRRDVQHAALDTHILRWMRDQGVENVPKSTPTGKKYLDLEQTFVKMVPEGMSPAEYDLEIWREYSVKRKTSNVL